LTRGVGTLYEQIPADAFPWPKMTYLNDYERRFHSQNGEDGILDFLISKLKAPTRELVEIGAAEGVENNSTHHIKKGYSAVLIEGDHRRAQSLRRFLGTLNPSGTIGILNGFATARNIEKLATQHFPIAPDFLSLDIDGIDAYVLDVLLAGGMRPSVLCLEYNCYLSPRSVSVIYDEAFSRYGYHPGFGLYFGVSVEGLKTIAGRYGYRFVCVDRSGTNAFFVLPERFSEPADTFTGLAFQYSGVFCRKYRRTGEQLADLVMNGGFDFVEIDETFRGHRDVPPG
jgi:hypothetical protein